MSLADTLAEDALETLALSAKDAWSRLTDAQRNDLERAARDLAALQVDALKGKDVAAEVRIVAATVKSYTHLLGEAAVSAFWARAEEFGRRAGAVLVAVARGGLAASGLPIP